jgi:two-component system, NarL family, nitrate/nitrite response regulator NarL
VKKTDGAGLIQNLASENGTILMALDHALQSQAYDMTTSEKSVIRVHLCGRPLIRRGLEHIFEGTGFVMSGASFHGPAHPSACEHPIPELFIIDQKHCPMPMVDLIKELKTLNSEARLILLTDHLDADAVLAARHAGADGICLESSRPEVLVRSMQLVMLGEVVVSSELILKAIAEPASEPEAPPELDLKVEPIFGSAPKRLLSNRETQVLGWLKEGAPNKVIARKLNVAEATIKVHVKAILKKIGVGNRSQAAIWAAQNTALTETRP